MQDESRRDEEVPTEPETVEEQRERLAEETFAWLEKMIPIIRGR